MARTSLKVLRNAGLRPNLEKDSNYENNNSYILMGQRVYNPQRTNGALNELYFEREVRDSEKELRKTFLEVLEDEISSSVIDEADDEFGLRDDQLLEVYCSAVSRYKTHKKWHRDNIERSQEILKLIELTKTFKHVKGASNSDLIIFDLQRKNIGEWE